MNNRILSTEDIRRAAPAAFSVSASPDLSDSYSHVTTIRVVDALRDDGWTVVQADQRRSRKPDSAEFNLHRITLTHPELPEHREGRPQMYLGNSANGTSAFRTLGGFLRMACLNQMYAGIKVVGGVFNHRGSSLEDRIVAGARELRKNFDKVITRFDLWSQVELSAEQQEEFARAAVALRWPTQAPVSYDLTEVLRPRRTADCNDASLWSTFNRVQESVVRGGFSARFNVKDDSGAVVGQATRTVRKITGLAASERINTGLWELAEAATPYQLTN